MSKVEVKGKNIHPVYRWLTKKELNGVKSSSVKWNFQKYLIDENGRKQVDKLNGFISRLFQHEMEHLQGRLMIGGKIHDEMPVDKAVEKIYDELSNYYSQHNNDLNI